jgi:hypothetical protein
MVNTDSLLVASPWWVNLAPLVPLASYLGWRTRGLRLSARQLTYAAIFAVAFGINEAAVVVYLRGASGLLDNTAAPEQVLARLPQNLIATELSREVATLVMLCAVSLLAVTRGKERWALFLWMFAFWDIFYYAGLWLIIRWPSSLLTQDVLFLIPTPWIAPVWFPILVSLLAIAAILLANRQRSSTATE